MVKSSLIFKKNKILLAYSSRKMLIIGQNSKQVHLKYSFHELLLISSGRYYLGLIFHYIKEILHVRTKQLLCMHSQGCELQRHIV